MVTWDLLICSIPHRHEKLCELLACLDQQMVRGVGALLWLDNLELPYGDKTQALVNASTADYVSCIDDDDLVAPDFIARIMAALQAGPDYVGFKVRYTVDGKPQIPVEHSLRHGRWENQPGMLIRDIAQFNPIRRELSLLGTWEGYAQAEVRWGNGVRASGRCKTEVWIPDEMYFYRNCSADTFTTVRQPMSVLDIKPPPVYPWLRSLGYFRT